MSGKKWVRKLQPRFLRRILRRKRNRKIAAGLTAILLAGITIGTVYQNMQPKIDPAAYTPLLNTIAKGESNGNYDAYFGDATNTSIRFTDMSVGDVLRWQKKYVQQGSVSSAVGRYQIIRPTLLGLVHELGIKPGARFDKQLQDKMAITLLERRGSLAYVEKKISRDQFAANLAQEWASLPKITGPNPDESYYASDGINKSQISITAVYDALAVLKAS
jgi:muramidase (phage lysozyme)